MAAELIDPRTLADLIDLHLVEYWREDAGTDDAIRLLESYGIPLHAIAMLTHKASSSHDVDLNTPQGQAAVFMQGFLLALDLARKLEGDSRRVELEHWRETGEAYGRVLAALAARAGGQLDLDREDLLNDQKIAVVVTVDNNTGAITVAVEAAA